MTTWIIDWGEKTVNGSRYALVQMCDEAEDVDVFLMLDAVGDPSDARVWPLEIAEDWEGMRYVEIGAVDKPYYGDHLRSFFEIEELEELETV